MTEKRQTIQLVSFVCGEVLAGLDLADVQEINRIDNIAVVPESPGHISGVINLRGEVITMIDLNELLDPRSGDDPFFVERPSRHNVFVRHQGEVIGLVTDGVSDIVQIETSSIEPPPANIRDSQSGFFRGVYPTVNDDLMMILDLSEILNYGLSTADVEALACS